MSVKWLDYKGKRILYSDYRGLQGEPAYETLELATQEVLASQTQVLILTNFTGDKATAKFMGRLKEFGRLMQPKVEKIACVGVTGIQGILLRAYVNATGNNVQVFNTEREAKEWLIQE